jgi:hypothetical protein
LKKSILAFYEDRKIKEEKLEEYKNSLVTILKTTKEIKLFTELMSDYLPLYNELKHFNAEKIYQNYRETEQSKHKAMSNAEEILPGIIEEL